MRFMLPASVFLILLAASTAVADPAPVVPAATPAPAAHACGCATIQAQLQHAFQLHEAGQYVEAASAFLAIATQAPAVRAFAARSLMEAGQLPEALEQAHEAVQAVDIPMTHFMLALVEARSGQDDAAMEQYQEVLDRDPNNASAHNNLGGLYYMREDFYRARVETGDALTLSKNADGKTIALANLAELDELEGNLQQAEEKLNEALDTAPELAVAYYELAVLYDVMGRTDASQTMEKYALQLDTHGAVQRATSYVWPELSLHAQALAAEAEGDKTVAVARWTALRGIEQSGGLHWSALAGRAAAHLAALQSAVAAPGSETAIPASPKMLDVPPVASLR